MAKRKLPDENHLVKVIFYKGNTDEISSTLHNMLAQNNIVENSIPQQTLSDNISNWNFLKQDKNVIDFYNAYKKGNQDITIYFLHSIAERLFRSRFYFDGGYDIDERQALDHKSTYKVLRFPTEGFVVRENRGYWPNERGGKGSHFIKLRQANQGYNLLDSTFKVIWPYLRDIRFVYSDEPIIWSRRTTNTYYGIGSNNKDEILYLLSILNSKVTSKIISFFKLESEGKREIMVSAALIKKEIKVPRIDKHNQAVKDEIIKQTAKLLSLEKTLDDIADFSGIMVQKFDEVSVEAGKIVLHRGNERYQLEMNYCENIVREAIDKHLMNRALLQKGKISISGIKKTPVIDYEIQKKIKEYVDDLVFSLYFGISINKLGLENSNKVRKACEHNRYYKICEI